MSFQKFIVTLLLGDIERQLSLPVHIASKKNHTISKVLPQKYSYYLDASWARDKNGLRLPSDLMLFL